MINPSLEEMLKDMSNNKYKLVVIASKLAHRIAKEEDLKISKPLSEAFRQIGKGEVEIEERLST
ncbi:MAG: DNA-directed RNA polymerase subunit omega [Coprothermobacterota bacterium]|nr:DNA-directed RNA polymerase subunit omega [Coprothermobacterota bacterium]